MNEPDETKQISRTEQIRRTLMRTRIATDLLTQMDNRADGPRRVIVEFNAAFPGGEAAARALLLTQMMELKDYAYSDVLRPSWVAVSPLLAGMKLIEPVPKIDIRHVERFNSLLTEKYLFASLTPTQIYELADLRAEVPNLSAPAYLVYKIWRDQDIGHLVHVSGRTIKGDAARVAFNSVGQDIVWAVADTGVSKHAHFDRFKNLVLPDGLRHWDFTTGHNESPEEAEKRALVDSDGHGSHVAGIIAGSTITKQEAGERGLTGPFVVDKIRIKRELREQGEVQELEFADEVQEISGIAPRCKIMSLKVMEKGASAHVSRLLAAIGYLQLMNGYGRHLKIHGLNLSVGYDFDPRSFTPGQSPLCQEVNRLVKSGVVVVVAAGNGGYGQLNSTGGPQSVAYTSSIADPGNAEQAITVGSTHRDMPHTYGVSYFSAKGPTADGRMKPDLVAPGERIVSCACMPDGDTTVFREQTGTSMAAPHVSGAIAAFLSVRREFRGRPEAVKKLFKDNATDLGRQADFQGAGLVDLMRTLQAV